jgi:hypothetical protein
MTFENKDYELTSEQISGLRAMGKQQVVEKIADLMARGQVAASLVLRRSCRLLSIVFGDTLAPACPPEPNLTIPPSGHTIDLVQSPSPNEDACSQRRNPCAISSCSSSRS